MIRKVIAYFNKELKFYESIKIIENQANDNIIGSCKRYVGMCPIKDAPNLEEIAQDLQDNIYIERWDSEGANLKLAHTVNGNCIFIAIVGEEYEYMFTADFAHFLYTSKKMLLFSVLNITGAGSSEPERRGGSVSRQKHYCR